MDEATPDGTRRRWRRRNSTAASRGGDALGVADGDPRLQPGAVIDVHGIADHLTGRYVLTELTNTLDDRHGFVSTSPRAPAGARERPSAPSPPSACHPRGRPEQSGPCAGLAPRLRGRGDRLAHGALPRRGRGKGIIALPNVGGSRPRAPRPRRSGDGHRARRALRHGRAAGQRRGGQGDERFTLVTHGGQRIRLDDRHNTLRLENGAGSSWNTRPARCASARRPIWRSPPSGIRSRSAAKRSISRRHDVLLLDGGCPPDLRPRPRKVGVEPGQTLVTIPGATCWSRPTRRAARSGAARTSARRSSHAARRSGCKWATRTCSGSMASASAWDTVTGLTDGTPPGGVKYHVREPGQDFVAEGGG